MQNAHFDLIKVLNYIHQHLDETIPLDALAQLANQSKFHFHRQFSQLTGLTVQRYISHVKMLRGAHQLAFRNHLKVIDIAMECGFDSPESFSRAFKRVMGHSPRDYRNDPDWQVLDTLKSLLLDGDMSIQLKEPPWTVTLGDFQPLHAALMFHKGHPSNLGHTLQQFIQWRKQNQLPPRAC